MRPASLITLALALLITLAALALWIATDRHAYTKYQVVEQVEVEPAPNDPFAQTGFYEGEAQTQTVTRDEFHFGLLPTPEGLFDKHMFSVVSVLVPTWIAFGAAAVWLQRRSRRLAESTA